MAASYAALLSVSQIIEQLQDHPRPSISLDKPQTKCLAENVAFLLHFLEHYSFLDSPEAGLLEGRMADAAYEAEDMIESRIVDQIEAQAHGQNLFSDGDMFYQGLQKLTEEMELIKNEITEIISKGKLRKTMPATGGGGGSLRRAPSSLGHTSMVGCDDIMMNVRDKLTYGESSRQVIPIVGMGGIGKTTLAKNIYANPVIGQHFDCRGWATISQDYDSKEILLEVLVCLKGIESKEDSNYISEDQLGIKLYQTLSGRRYLVVMDDMWSIEAWEKVKFYFPENGNGSRIVVTTRLLNLASQLSGSYGLEMSFLDEDNSWKLLRKSVFGEESCPLELEEMGKRIAKSCMGLPLSITVIGALLSKHEQSSEYWEYVLENLNRILTSEADELCLRILRLSYVELPVHMKPCFLYMGIFREDSAIPKSRLIKLWVAEGFIKPISGKCLEMVAEDILQNLVDRNLLLVHKLGSTGKIKLCTVHDLLRDLCLKEAHRSKFFCIRRSHDPIIQQDFRKQRRVGFNDAITSSIDDFDIGRMQSPLLRSLIWPIGNGTINLQRLNCKLLRVLSVVTYSPCTPPDSISANSRFIEIFCENIHRVSSSFLSFVCQSLLAFNPPNPIPLIDIWKMPQLRHINLNKFRVPPHEEKCSLLVLGNLQTLKGVVNLKFSAEVVKRILNIKKLAIDYDEPSSQENIDYGLNNLSRLTNLECLCCNFHEPVLRKEELGHSLSFPHSLRKLTMCGTNLPWEEMGSKIGKLPHLQVLKLCDEAFTGPEWETVEGHFQELKYLKISFCRDLRRWVTDSSHFPRLERLFLVGLFNLEEIPRGIGDIATLESIGVADCGHSVVSSAKEILQEQEELGNVGFQLSFGE